MEKDTDAILLTETFIENPENGPTIKKAKLFHREAQRTNSTGRPSGGCLIAIKKDPEAKLNWKSEHAISVSTQQITMMTAYFPPTTEVSDIIQEIAEHNDRMNNSPAVIYGDFNCRIDAKDPIRGLLLEEALNILGFQLLNDKTKLTYHCIGGGSAIDLVFTRDISPVELKICEQEIWRKHTPLEVEMPTKKIQIAEKALPPTVRKVDTRQLNRMLKENKDGLNKAKSSEELVRSLTNIIHKAAISPQQKTSHGKPWFDKECQTAKRTCMSALRGTLEFAKLKRDYKHLCRAKRIEYELLKLKERIERGKTRPWELTTKRKNTGQPPISMTEWTEHYRELLGATNEISLPYFEHKDENKEEVTNGEVELAVRKMKRGKAAGPDGVAIEILKDNTHIIPLITKALNIAFTNSEIPSTWRCSYLRPIYKSGNPTLPENYRGISFTPHILKILTWIITQKLTTKHGHQLHNNQFGFIKGRSCEKAINKLIEYVEEHQGKCFGLFIDFKKAFDKVPRDRLLSKLEENYAVTPNLMAMIRAALEPTNIRINDGHHYSEIIKQTGGLPQGDALSPMLFIMYVNSILQKLSRRKVLALMYADDLAVMATTKEEIQWALGTLRIECEELKMELNVKKTKWMAFRKAGRNPKWEIWHQGKRIEQVSRFIYLGVVLTPALSPTQHIGVIAAKCATETAKMGNLKKFALKSCKDLWRMKIRPIATYAARSIITRSNSINLKALDAIKARFLKICLGVGRTTSNTLVFQICDEPTMVEDICTEGIPLRPDELLAYSCDRNTRIIQLQQQGHLQGPAFTSQEWKEAMKEKLRSATCRITANGLHHKICVNEWGYHQPNEGCICKMCGRTAEDWQHILGCVALEDRSLIERARAAEGET